MSWTHITDPDEAASLLPMWLGRRLVGLRGRFGLLLGNGDVIRVTSIAAVHHSSDGVVMLDVALDDAGVPDGVDLAWRPKHFLGAPVPGATMATVNLAHVVAAVEFTASEMSHRLTEIDAPTADEVVMELDRAAAQVRETNLEIADLSDLDRVDGMALTTFATAPERSAMVGMLPRPEDGAPSSKKRKKAKK